MRPRKFNDLLSSWWPPAALAAVILIRFLFIVSNDLAMDEPFTVFYAQADLRTLFGMLPGENNPPLFFLLLHYWIGWFGISPLSVRFLPCLFSILTAVMLYLTGKEFFSRPAGFLAATVFTLSDYHQLFAHEARVYSLFALLTVISMYFFLALAARPGKVRYAVLLAFVNALLVYAHFFGFFIFLIQSVSLLIIPALRKSISVKYLVSVVFSLVAYLPYFPVMVSRLKASSGGTWVPPPVWSDLYTMIWRYTNAPVAAVTFLAILGVGLTRLVFLAARGRFALHAPSVVVLTWFLVPYFTMFLVSFALPVFLDRYTVFISVGFFLLSAVTLTALVRSEKLLTIVSALLILMMAVTFHPRADNKRRLKHAVEYVAAFTGPGAAVLICPEWLAYGFAYHYDQAIFRDYSHFRDRLAGRAIYPVNDSLSPGMGLIHTASRVIVFEEWASLTDPQGTLFKRLHREFRFVKTTGFYENFRVHLYER